MLADAERVQPPSLHAPNPRPTLAPREQGVVSAILPQRNRRVDRLAEPDRAALEAARLTVGSDQDQLLLKRRSELVERSFVHVLDCGGARRTTLRGRENIRKRYLIQAASEGLEHSPALHLNECFSSCSHLASFFFQIRAEFTNSASVLARHCG